MCYEKKNTTGMPKSAKRLCYSIVCATSTARCRGLLRLFKQSNVSVSKIDGDNEINNIKEIGPWY